MGLMFVATILLVAASIGMFQLRPWARVATIGWGIYSICMKVIGATVQHVLISMPMMEQAPAGPQRSAMIVMIGIGIAYVLLMIGYYLLVIFMLMRPNVVEAFAPDEIDNDRGGWDTHPVDTVGADL